MPPVGLASLEMSTLYATPTFPAGSTIGDVMVSGGGGGGVFGNGQVMTTFGETTAAVQPVGIGIEIVTELWLVDVIDGTESCGTVTVN